jgi:hypothetical protein
LMETRQTDPGSIFCAGPGGEKNARLASRVFLI